MKITFIQTGGTIDKDYPKVTKGWAFEIANPAVTRVLEKLNPSFEYEIITALKKDSTEITADDRKKLAEICSSCESDKIIITHGTDTMAETAQYLSSIENKVIILTGAMRPERFANSDAPITIGMAIGAINILEKGTYIAMHGKVVSADKIERNMETGQYV